MTHWSIWVGWSLFYCGIALGLLSIECYAGEHREAGDEPLGTATVFDEAWLLASVSITAGLFLVFETGARDIFAMLAAGYVLMYPVKRLLRPGS